MAGIISSMEYLCLHMHHRTQKLHIDNKSDLGFKNTQRDFKALLNPCGLSSSNYVDIYYFHSDRMQQKAFGYCNRTRR